MPRTGKPARSEGRPGRLASLPMPAYPLAFVLLAAAVYLGGRFRQATDTDDAGDRFRATSAVVHEVPSVNLLSESPLARVESGSFGPGGPARVQATRAPDGRTVEVTVTCEQADAETAASMADLLAGQYAEDLRRWWGAGRLAGYAAAREAAEAAGCALAEARRELDAATETQGHRTEAPAPAADHPHLPPAAEPQQPPGDGATTLVDNPEWVGLGRRLGELQRRREAMLATRTALHPAVQEVDHEIQVLQGRMAGTPRFMPSEAPAERARSASVPDTSQRESPWPADTRPAQPPEHSAEEPSRRGREAVERLRAAVAKAEAAHSEASAGERRAWQALHDEPEIERRGAVVEFPGTRTTAAAGGARLVALAVCSGLALWAGLLMLANGAAVAPVVRSVAELQSLLGIPVLGPIPAPARTSRQPPEGGRHQRHPAPRQPALDRAIATAWTVAGLAALTAAAGVALRAWGLW
jgi:hypothetical protein